MSLDAGQHRFSADAEGHFLWSTGAPFADRRLWLEHLPGGREAYRRQWHFWNEFDCASMTRSEKFAVLGIDDQEHFRSLKRLLVGRTSMYWTLAVDPWGRRSPRAQWCFAEHPRKRGNWPLFLKEDQILDYWLRRRSGRQQWLSTARAFQDRATGAWLTDLLLCDVDDHDRRGDLLRRHTQIVKVFGPPAYVFSTSTQAPIEIPRGPDDFHGIQSGYLLGEPARVEDVKDLARELGRTLPDLDADRPIDEGNGRRVPRVELFPRSANAHLRVGLGVDSYVLDPMTLVPIADGPPRHIQQISKSVCSYFDYHHDRCPTLPELQARLEDVRRRPAKMFTGAATSCQASASSRRDSVGRCPAVPFRMREPPRYRMHAPKPRVKPVDVGPAGSESDICDATWMEKGRHFWEEGLPEENTRVEFVRAGIFYDFTNVDGAHDEVEMYRKVRDHFETHHHGFSTLYNENPRGFESWLRSTVRAALRDFRSKRIVPLRGQAASVFLSSDTISSLITMVTESRILVRRERLPALEFLHELSRYVLAKVGMEIRKPVEVPIPWEVFCRLPHCQDGSSKVASYVKNRITWLREERVIDVPEKQVRRWYNGPSECYTYSWKLPLASSKDHTDLFSALERMENKELDQLFGRYHRRQLRLQSDQPAS
jgi:hypothetical protein